MIFQTIPSASVLLLLLTGVLSSESAIKDISSQKNDTYYPHDNASIPSIESIFPSIETLPVPMPQSAAEPRNYVAYIPVPISDDEDEEEEDDDEYYDDEEEYYDDDEEYGGDSLSWYLKDFN